MPAEFGQKRWNSAGTPNVLGDPDATFLNIRLRRYSAVSGFTSSSRALCRRHSRQRLPALMVMHLAHPQPLRRVPFEIELDHNRRFVPHYPSVVTRFNRHHLRRFELPRAPVRVSDVHLPPSQESDMRVKHASPPTIGCMCVDHRNPGG